jgi:putative (di)nucleoside polyphosphate hydrolase
MPANRSASSLYRLNVAAIIQDREGRILICERADFRDSWQFPQGGLEPGESPEAGLPRELLEELSLEPTDYIVRERRGPYRYLFPEGRTKKGYRGQEQFYFRLELLAPDSKINVAVPKPEFRAVRWIVPGDFYLAWLHPMKHEVYRSVFRDFFGLELAG